MAAASTIIAALGLAVAVGAGTHQAVQAREQAGEAKDEAKKQERAQRQLQDELRLKQERTATEAAARQQRDRQRAAAGMGAGREGTIRTGPYGIPENDAAFIRKQLLGV